MSIVERQEMDALKARVEQLERAGSSSVAELVAAIDGRLKAIETRSKPGPKPKVQE